jgi:hypothetical protein
MGPALSGKGEFVGRWESGRVSRGSELRDGYFERPRPSRRSDAGTFTSNAGRFSVHAERSLDLGFKWNLTTILNEGSRI